MRLSQLLKEIQIVIKEKGDLNIAWLDSYGYTTVSERYSNKNPCDSEFGFFQWRPEDLKDM